jgi:hypothetical protein
MLRAARRKFVDVDVVINQATINKVMINKIQSLPHRDKQRLELVFQLGIYNAMERMRHLAAASGLARDENQPPKQTSIYAT